MKLLTNPRRKYFSEPERVQWVTRFRFGGLTQAQFAEQNGLKLKTLQRWLYGRGAQAAAKGRPRSPAHGSRSQRIDRTAVAIHRKPRRTPNATFREFILPSVGPARAGWAAEVTWPSGVTVCFSAEAKAAWMGAVLGAVRQVC